MKFLQGAKQSTKQSTKQSAKQGTNCNLGKLICRKYYFKKAL
jgi:hypothetical protein